MDRTYMPLNMQGNYYNFRNKEEERRDIEYMKHLYPNHIRCIQENVEECCDKLEYDGSVMFDEYPDKLMLRLLENKIVDSCKCDENSIWINSIVPVLLYNEMYRRRSRRRDARNTRNIWAGYPPAY